MTSQPFSPSLPDVVDFLRAAEMLRRQLDNQWSRSRADHMAKGAFSMLLGTGALSSPAGSLSDLSPQVLYSCVFLDSGLPVYQQSIPTAVSDLLSLPPTPQTLANAFLLLGVDPWNGKTNLPESVDLATSCGFSDFVINAVQLSSAPAPEKLYAMDTAENGTFLQHLAHSSASGIALVKLAELHKSQVPTNLVVRALSVAQPRSVAPLLAMSTSPLTSSQINKIKKAWTMRLRAGDLKSERVSSMLGLLDPSATNKEQRAGDLVSSGEIARLLATEWYAADSSNALKVQCVSQFSKDFLIGQFSHKSGSFSGNWTGFAANCMASIRASSDSSSGNTHARGWISATDYQPGALSSCLGVQWRDDISLDGVMWLAMYGQSSGPQLDKEIQNFKLLLGIEDMDQWSRECVDHAMAFTASVLNKNGINPQVAMTKAWSRALENCPAARDYVRPWTVEKRQELFYYLSSDLAVPQCSFAARTRSPYALLLKQLYEDVLEIRDSKLANPLAIDFSDPLLPAALSSMLVAYYSGSLDAAATLALDPKHDVQKDRDSMAAYNVLSTAINEHPTQVDPGVLCLMDKWSKTILSLNKKLGLKHLSEFARQTQSWVKVKKLSDISSKSSRVSGPRPSM